MEPRSRTFRLLLLLLLLLVESTRAFNILGICPSTSYSHQQPFQALMKALARRGHKVTVISPVPLKVPMENYTDVDLSFTYKREDCTKLRFMSAFELLRKNMNGANALCAEQLFSRPIQQLIERKEKFDAIIIEQLWFQCFYSLVKFYNYPVLIGFLSVGNLPYAMDSVGNPDDPFLNPDMAYAFAGRMNFKERVWNYVYTTYTRVYYNYFHLPRAQSVAERFSPGISCSAIDRNFSLVILGNNHVFGYPKPLLPNVIEVHSLQITGDPGTLPKEAENDSVLIKESLLQSFTRNDKQLNKCICEILDARNTLMCKDIQEFLDGSSEGAIYFSLGSNLQSQQLPASALRALSDAFGSLKQRVLWKHDGPLPVQAANIKFVKWAPQQAILAHRNTKVYIMQGGLQSIQEAVYYGVPLLALPFFGDQNFNGRKLVDAKIGKVLHVDTMTKESIVTAINELLSDQAYSRNIKRMSAILKDEPIKPIDKALWNIEHVLKFPDAQHLRYHGKDISFIEYYGIFVFMFVLISILMYIHLALCWILATFLKRYIHEHYLKTKKLK